MAQEGGAQQSLGEIPAPLSYYSGVPMRAWGSGAAIPPPNFAVPNVAFAEPFAHLPQPQKSGHHWRIRCKKHIAAIQTNANQMGEGNANIAYEL
jgi:hypothetical protein